LAVHIHGAQDKSNARSRFVNLTGCFYAVENRHREIKDYEIGRKLSRPVNCLLIMP
jgi:hypothetical protein